MKYLSWKKWRKEERRGGKGRTGRQAVDPITWINIQILSIADSKEQIDLEKLLNETLVENFSYLEKCKNIQAQKDPQ